jgi:hypothetical protein
LVREARALLPNRIGAFREIIGKYKLLDGPEQDRELRAVYSQCAEEAQSLSLEVVSKGKLCCGNDDYIGASVNLRWWLYSLFDSVPVTRFSRSE